jgi:hypothetical protein
VRTEDIARFGQLHLQNGKWNDQQLLSSEWVQTATSRQTSNGSNPKSDWDQGYGYQFWRCRHGAYRGDGAFGQYCLVLPEQDAVIAITSGVKDMQAVLNLIWDKLLPAFGAPILPDPVNHPRLQTALAALAVPTATGETASPLAAKMGRRTYRFPSNDRDLEAVTLRPSTNGRGVTLAMTVNGVENTFDCGAGEWIKGRGSFGPHIDEPFAASVGWVEPDRCVIKLCAYETPYYYTLTFNFSGDDLAYDATANVGFGRTRQTTLNAKAEKSRIRRSKHGGRKRDDRDPHKNVAIDRA